MLKLAFPLCAFALLQTCSNAPAPAAKAQAQTPKSIALPPPPPNMDSPIIISDGSTHLKHKNGIGRQDFSFSMSGAHAAVSDDPSFYTREIDCNNYSSCPSGHPVTLYSGWHLSAYDQAGHVILETGASDTHTVTFNLNDKNYSTASDAETGGTDIVEPTWKFDHATVYDGHGGPQTLTCKAHSAGQSCELQIIYRNY